MAKLLESRRPTLDCVFNSLGSPSGVAKTVERLGSQFGALNKRCASSCHGACGCDGRTVCLNATTTRCSENVVQKHGLQKDVSAAWEQAELRLNLLFTVGPLNHDGAGDTGNSIRECGDANGSELKLWSRDIQS